MTVNSDNEEINGRIREARLLLGHFREQASPGSAALADDILLFCYRLRDNCRIGRSTSARFKGPSFDVLHELLYQLESRPEETLQSSEWISFIETLLLDIVSGRIVLTKQR